MKKAECVFPNRPLDMSRWVEDLNDRHTLMNSIALLIREKSEAAGGVPEEIQEAYWKIWWYLDCPPYCYIDV